MKPLRHHLRASLLLASLLPASSFAGSILYGVNFSGSTPLYEIDQGSGAASAVGGAVLSDVGDLTSNQIDTLWGVTLGTANELITIDPLTGAQLSNVAFSGVNANTGGGAITSLAYNPVSGRLYGNTSTGFGDTLRGDDLYEIDPLTGALTFVGVINFEDIFALAFDQLGVLFGITNAGELLSIDTTTGAGASIASGLGAGLFDLASRPEDNAMFLTVGFSSLGTIDTGTGAITPIGGYVDANNVVGLAFLGEVPEPATVALLGAGLLAWRVRAGTRRR